MKIRVTKLDIKRGTASSDTECPVARAVRRCTGFKGVHASLGWITTKSVMFPTPDEARDFMKRFDYGCFVEPFEFDLP